MVRNILLTGSSIVADALLFVHHRASGPKAMMLLMEEARSMEMVLPLVQVSRLEAHLSSLQVEPKLNSLQMKASKMTDVKDLRSLEDLFLTDCRMTMASRHCEV